MGSPLLSVIRVLLLILLVAAGQSWASFVTVQSFECTNNEKLCRNLICQSIVSRNRVPMINCGCLLPRPMYNMTVELKFQTVKGGRTETLVSAKENLCNIVHMAVRGQIITRVFETIKKYFNVFECPFQGNVTATNMPIGLNFAPGFMPASDYRLLAEVRDVDEFVMNAKLNFAIRKNKFLARN